MRGGERERCVVCTTICSRRMCGPQRHGYKQKHGEESSEGKLDATTCDRVQGAVFQDIIHRCIIEWFQRRLRDPQFLEHCVERLERDRLDQAGDPHDQIMLIKEQIKTHYPSTPASKARRLSSSEDMPVSARMRAGVDRRPFSCLRLDSICRICAVAPTPSKIGIDRSKSTTLRAATSIILRRRRGNVGAYSK